MTGKTKKSSDWPLFSFPFLYGPLGDALNILNLFPKVGKDYVFFNTTILFL